MDVGGGSGSGGGGGSRGGGVALALLGSRWGWAADASACAARLRPRAAGGGQRRLLRLAHVGAGPLTWWLALHAYSTGQRWGRVSGARGRIRGHLRR